MAGRLAVAVHAGAGWRWQGDSDREAVRQVLRKAVKSGRACTDVASAFTAAADVVEACELTNTGRGSFPRSDGSVRCDSCVYVLAERTVDAVEVGAVLCNSSASPMVDALDVLLEQRCLDCSGVVLPSVVTGLPWGSEGAGAADLLTRRMSAVFDSLNSHSSFPAVASPQDTVGVIVADIEKQCLYVGSSSGGGLMCSPRRVGCAGVPGAGCWAGIGGDVCVGVTASGQGEAIIRTGLAGRIGAAVIEALRQERQPAEAAADVLRSLAKWDSGSDGKLEPDVLPAASGGSLTLAVLGVAVQDGYATLFYASVGPGAFPVAGGEHSAGMSRSDAAGSGLHCGEWPL